MILRGTGEARFAGHALNREDTMRPISAALQAPASSGRRHPSQAVRTCAILALLFAGGFASADDGDPDPTFSGDGKAWFTWPTTYQGADVLDITTRSVAALADGSIVTAGRFETIGPDRFQAGAVTKFNANGAIDADFGNAGWQLVYFEAQPNKDEILGVFPSGGNTLLVVGQVDSMSPPYARPALLRLLANGTLDTSFGIGGKVVIGTQPFGGGAGFNFRTAVQAPDGKILLAGSCTNCGHGSFEDFTALRLNANGSVDTSFGNAGWVSFGRTDVDDHYLPEAASSIAVDTQGRIVLGGYSETFDDQDHQQQPLLVRTTPDGQLDAEFNGTGYVDINLPGSLAIAAIAIDAYNDGIVVAASITNTQGVTPGTLLMRTRRDGSQDTNFGSGGLVVLQLEEGVNITALAIRRDRRITAAGWIDPNGSDTRDFFAARTHFNGVLDATFDGNGVNRYPFGFATNGEDVPAAMVLSGERPVIAGLLTNLAPNPSEFASGVLRLQSDLIFEDGLD
jgi:uncharacterized delta-60 repeat protein